MLKEKKDMIEQILLGVFDTGYIDDHTGKRYIPEVVAIQFTKKGVEVCFASEIPFYFSLNPFWMEGGEIHLLRRSCGGVVDLRQTDLEGGVAKYNKQHEADKETLMVFRRDDPFSKFLKIRSLLEESSIVARP